MISKINVPPGFSAAVIHAHTTYSDGLATPRELVKICREQKIRVLVITDHDTISGVQEAKAAGEKYGVEVICGEEIQTSLPRGLHVIGLFLKKAIPHSKPLIWTVNEIQKQGALAIVPHPLARIFGIVPAPTAAIQMGDLKELILETRFDGIELQYPGITDCDKKRLNAFYQKSRARLGAVIGSSDSHFGEADIFRYLTVFAGKSARDLRGAIESKKTKIIEGPTDSIPFSNYLLQKKKALVDLGIRRYRGMIRRWVGLDFESRNEVL